VALGTASPANIEIVVGDEKGDEYGNKISEILKEG
jgi:hypothetical protein